MNVDVVSFEEIAAYVRLTNTVRLMRQERRYPGSLLKAVLLTSTIKEHDKRNGVWGNIGNRQKP